MCKRIFSKDEMNEKNYNFVISNVILSQTGKFTYNDIIQKLKTMFGSLTDRIENVVKDCLIRLREDGFLSVLGASYSVVEINI